MERAAGACVKWLLNQPSFGGPFHIFCGKGNNGGDGLAMARLLLDEGYTVTTYVLENGREGSPDFENNLKRYTSAYPFAPLQFVQGVDDLKTLPETDIVIDALFGTGLARPLTGLAAQAVAIINQSGATVISIDLPSGLLPDRSSKDCTVVKAAHTLTFQCYKLPLLLQENAPFIGQVHVLDIQLHPAFSSALPAIGFVLDESTIRKLFQPRQRFSHKGSFGHALLVGGSYGKMGAMVLAAKACLAAGAGLTTALIPACGYTVLQTAVPEAMVLVDEEERFLATLPSDIEKFTAIGIGPGMGTTPESQHLLSYLLKRYRKPLVIDADGLNCLSLNKEWLSLLPPHSILTPHPKEFDRLFGEHEDDFCRMNTAIQKAKELQVIIVLKSHHSLIAFPDDAPSFNSTGNAGMAKGGSGDVLTGILTALLAQGYAPQDAARLGVYLHGLAADEAVKEMSMEALLPSHLIQYLSNVFLKLAG